MNELSKDLLAIVMRNGIELWVEADRANNLVDLLALPNAPQFVRFDERVINRADIVGVFKASDMEDLTRRRNGEWKCKKNVWHERRQECECRNVTPEFKTPDEEITDEQRQRNLDALAKAKYDFFTKHARRKA